MQDAIVRAERIRRAPHTPGVWADLVATADSPKGLYGTEIAYPGDTALKSYDKAASRAWWPVTDKQRAREIAWLAFTKAHNTCPTIAFQYRTLRNLRQALRRYPHLAETFVHIWQAYAPPAPSEARGNCDYIDLDCCSAMYP